MLPSHRKQVNLRSKSIDWFLYQDNTGTYWVNHLIMKWSQKKFIFVFEILKKFSNAV